MFLSYLVRMLRDAFVNQVVAEAGLEEIQILTRVVVNGKNGNIRILPPRKNVTRIKTRKNEEKTLMSVHLISVFDPASVKNIFMSSYN